MADSQRFICFTNDKSETFQEEFVYLLFDKARLLYYGKTKNFEYGS